MTQVTQTKNSVQWLFDLENGAEIVGVDGLVLVAGYKCTGRPPEEVAMMEKAASYGAHSVFFEAGRNGRASIAQAFIFVADSLGNDNEFAELHKRLWSWGGVPLIYRKLPGLVQLFRCAHKADFVSESGRLVCNPIKTLRVSSAIAAQGIWWDASRIRNGTLWDDPLVCKEMLSASKSAHRRLIDAVRQLNITLNEESILKKHLRRKLLIISLLIAYLEERGVFQADYFSQFQKGATKFFQVLANGKALVKLLEALEERFNGHVFVLNETDRLNLAASPQLARFARLVEAKEGPEGQLNLWKLYSFKDLPVELISHIYQLFVKDSDSSVYTPPFLVRLMLEEVLSWERLDRLKERGEVILDPSCGSGVFLVEAYKRLVLHWRSRNYWKKPSIFVLKSLLKMVHGVDEEEGAVELAAFSLCLALCDALEPLEIRTSISLFPQLAGKTLHHSCFFEVGQKSLLKEPIGVVVGNPPFESNLSTPGAIRSYQEYEKANGTLPDKQLAYLFLHEAMGLISKGGVLSMLQPYSFLYNQQSREFRKKFFASWDIREVLDFVSVRGLFQKGNADTKVVVIVAAATPPPTGRKILHATFRRSGRADAEQGFDIDYYDLHWLPRKLVIENDSVWRADLLGGGRVLEFIDRLKKFRTLEQYAKKRDWDFGEGFIQGSKGRLGKAEHIIGKSLLPSSALTKKGIEISEITKVEARSIEGQRSAKRFTPPMLLVREHEDLQHAIWNRSYLTYRNEIVGFAAPPADKGLLSKVEKWLTDEALPLSAYAAGISVRLFTQRATSLSSADICSLPYPESGTLDLSPNEKVIVKDIVEYQRDFIRLGEDSNAIVRSGKEALPEFAEAFIGQMNTVYRNRPLQICEGLSWPGVICQPFVFGNGKVDWNGADELRNKLKNLLHEQLGETLHVVRIARIYDGKFIFLLKPDRLRYWLRSVALRDADETLSDLRTQGL